MTFQAIDQAAERLSHQWYAAYTLPRHEKRVAEALAERGVETFLPLYRMVRSWKKSAPVQLELPLFPCYTFVHISRSERGSVLSVPGVVSIVGSSKEPWPLPSIEIDALRLGTQMASVEPHPFLATGERVRVKVGLMTGIEGIVSRKKGACRFVLSLDAIMRSVSIEINAQDLETSNSMVCRPHRSLPQPVTANEATRGIK